MKASSRVASLLAITIVSMLLFFAPSSDAVLTCSTVISNIRPCVTYLRSGSGMPPSDCCTGAKALAAAASTPADRRAACTCLQSASRSLNPKVELAKALPANCGISLGYTISPSVDCTKIT